MGQDIRVIPVALMTQVMASRRRLRIVGVLAVGFGLLSLIYMLVMATAGLSGALSMVKVGFLAAGAVGVGIGLGLLMGAGSARGAGAVWFVAWGITNLVAGFAAAISGDRLLGIFTLVTGGIHLMFASFISSQDMVFLCDFVGPEVTEEQVRAGLEAAASAPSLEMQTFLDTVLHPLPPPDVPS